MVFERSLLGLLALSFAACDGGGTGDGDDTGGFDDSLPGSPSDFADACAVAGVDCRELSDGTQIGFLSGDILEDLTLEAAYDWVIRGGVFIGDGTRDGDGFAAPTTLTIEPGTTLFGDSATAGFLVITRGSKILAEGTAADPIVFTSTLPEGERGASDWGGLIINGNAPSNVCNTSPSTDPQTSQADLDDCDLTGEAGSGTYGGPDEDDDSGVLTYVRVEFAGTLVSNTQELNGFAFQGVGRGTTVDHIHAHRTADDCIEFFGGTVEATHLIATGCGDDSIDWTDGFTGKIQYAVVAPFDGTGDNGFEMDNNGDANDVLPRSAPSVSNATVYGAAADMGRAHDDGLLIREGTGGLFDRLVVAGWGDACVAMDQTATYEAAWADDAFTGELAITNSLFHCPDATEAYADRPEEATPFTVAELVDIDGATGNAEGSPDFAAPDVEDGPDFTTSASTVTGVTAGKLDGDFFETTDFKGAMSTTDWTSWTSYPLN